MEYSKEGFAMTMDETRRVSTKVSREALIVAIIIGSLFLPVIAGIGLVRFAGARPASDAGRVVFVRGGFFWTMDADGGNEKQFDIGGFTPAWSPDGDKIAFCSHKDSWKWDTNDIYVINKDTRALSFTSHTVIHDADSTSTDPG
jgi:hypothetical protein